MCVCASAGGCQCAPVRVGASVRVPVCVCQCAFLSVRAYQCACVQVYLSARLETDIQNLSLWFKANGMLFNGDKCQFFFIEYHAQLVINMSRKVKKENCRVSILPIMYKASQIWETSQEISKKSKIFLRLKEILSIIVGYLDNNSARPL